MSSYGPPGRPHSDQPQDPYGQPSDSWGGEDEWGGDPAAAAPSHRHPGHERQGYDQRGYEEWAGQAGYDQRAGRHGYGQPGYGQSGFDDAGYRPGGYSTEPNGFGDAEGGYGEGAGGYGGSLSGWTGLDGYPAPGTSPAPAWKRPVAPARSSGRLTATIVVVLAVLVLSGAATAFFLVNRDKEPTTSPTTPAAGATGGAQPGTGPTTPTEQSATPAPESSAEARFAVKGQCLVNDGTDADPKMRIVACGPNTYEVLARFDGTTDFKGKCGTVKGYQFHYFFDSELDALDFVLCLKKR